MARINFFGKWASVNGKIVPLREAQIPPNDLGFMRGDAVFDVMEAKDTIVFHPDLHFERFLNAAEQTRMSRYIQKEDLEKAVISVLDANSFRKSFIYMYLTSGLTRDGFTPATQPRLYIYVSKNNGARARNISLKTVVFRRQFPNFKISADYFAAEVAMRMPYIKDSFDDVLYVKPGLSLEEDVILETSRRNFGIVDNTCTIITPDKDILNGVTMEIVLRIAKENGFKVKRKTITRKDVSRAMEAFITGTTSGVLPVVRIDNMRFRTFEIVEKLRDLFYSYRKDYYRKMKQNQCQ